MKLDTMTEQDLKKLVFSRLQRQGLDDVISIRKSQFLDMSLTAHDSFFAEVVLTDASRLPEVEKTLRNLKEELSAKAVSLDYIARGEWRIERDKIRRDKKLVSTGTQMKRALGIVFLVRLQSGKESIDVEVLVTSDALDILATRFGYSQSDTFQWSADKPGEEEILKELVARFLEEQLSQGGESYWDPVKYPELELNGPAVSYLLGHSATLMELVEAVNDAFSPPAVQAFLNALEISSIRINEFDLALSELSNFLGGAYARDQAFSTSAAALFSHLKPSEQELLRHHYLHKVKRLLTDHPELREQFPKAFG